MKNCCKHILAVATLLAGPLLFAQEPSQQQAPSAATEGAVKPEAEPQVEASRSYTVPAGTKVLLSLKNAINTKSAKVGDGVYLVSSFPVVVQNKMLIPPGVYVQGVIDHVQRPGRVKGRAQVGMHFTSMIFPNGSVVEIPGMVNALPGSGGPTVSDKEGTIEQAGSKGKDAATAAGVALSGASIGSIAGAASGSPGKGAMYGGLAGAAVGGLVTLFSRGSDIEIEQGTSVEMLLQRPLVLEPSTLQGSAESGVRSGFVPSAGQARPMNKPQRRTSILCPLGGLGCN